MMNVLTLRKFLWAMVGGAVGLVLLATTALAAVDDPVDEWAKFDITHLDAQVDGGYLIINLGLRDAISFLPNPLDPAYPVIEFFLDSDQDSATGDYRLGAVAGTDFLIKCSGTSLFSCTLYIPPYDRLKEMQILPFGSILGASVTLTNNRTLTLRLPTTAIGGSDSLDIFAVAYFKGHNAITSHKILSGNGDRAPNAGALNTATGNVIVRHPGASVKASLIDDTNAGQNAYKLEKAQFRTIGDQFEIDLSFNQPIDLSNFTALHGGIVFDTDRRLTTGQLQMQINNSHGLGYEIPTWGGDVELSFWLDDLQSLTSFGLRYGRSYSPTLFTLPITFGSPCGQETYPLTGLVPCNDGSWHVKGNRLIMTGSLSVFDSFTEVADLLAPGSHEIVRHATDGRMLARVFILDEATGAEHVTPEMGRAFDTGISQVREPLMWDFTSMISAADPLDYGGLVSGFDLVRVDAQVADGMLVVKGVLSLWSDVDCSGWYEILLDTDMNSSTGEFVANSFVPGKPAIGADYVVNITTVCNLPLISQFVELVRPDKKVEAHDAFLFPEPHSPYVADKEDGFTVTIPLESLGNPDQFTLFVTTRRYSIIPDPNRYDIAPPAPIHLITEPEVLTVSKAGSGSGKVTSNPVGIDCGTDCSESYATGTRVTLTATPDSGSTFSGWSGACSGVAKCVVPMTSAKNVVATFDLAKKADFIITGITLNPISPKVNSAFSAKMTIKNQGNATGNARQLGVWKNTATAKACKATANKYVWIGNLAAGASKTVTVTGLMIGSKGTKTLRAFVDSNCGTRESNENNNQTIKSYTVK